MHVDFEDLGGLKYKIAIRIEAADLARHKARLARAYAHQVNIPGFRPGHAPLDLVARKLGPTLDDEAKENAIGQAMRETLESRKLKPSTDPSMEIKDRQDDGSFMVYVEFESFPTVDVTDYLGVQIAEPVLPPIGDVEVDGALERMRQRIAKFENKAEDSVGHDGDMAVVDLTITDPVDDSALAETRESRVRVGDDDEPVKEAGRQLLGMKIDEETSITGPVGKITARGLTKTADVADQPQVSETPEGEAAPEPASRTVKATMKVKRLMERKVPDVDETLAKRFGAESVDDLKAKILEGLMAERAEARKDLLKEAVLNALVAANPVEVGAETVARLADAAVEEAKGRMLPGMTPEQRAGIDLGIPREDSEAEARQNLARMVLLQTIAEKEGITVSDEDIESHMQNLAAEHHVPLPKLKAHFDDEKLENLARTLRVEKTIDMLLRYAVIGPAVVQPQAAVEAPAETQPVADPEAEVSPEANP